MEINGFIYMYYINPFDEHRSPQIAETFDISKISQGLDRARRGVVKSDGKRAVCNTILRSQFFDSPFFGFARFRISPGHWLCSSRKSGFMAPQQHRAVCS